MPHHFETSSILFYFSTQRGNTKISIQSVILLISCYNNLPLDYLVAVHRMRTHVEVALEIASDQTFPDKWDL